MYLELIKRVVSLGKKAIMLVPEISLTTQTKRRFISRFGDVVSVLHSKMTTLEKQTEYKRIVKGQAKIVIGPRSALFVPLKNIGLKSGGVITEINNKKIKNSLPIKIG